VLGSMTCRSGLGRLHQSGGFHSPALPVPVVGTGEWSGFFLDDGKKWEYLLGDVTLHIS